MRRLALFVVLVTLGASLIALPRLTQRSPDPSRLSWVATAYQHGVVGYRDPAGAISPDGRSIAYSEGRFLRVRHIDGGPSADFPRVSCRFGALPGTARTASFLPMAFAAAAGPATTG